MQLTQAGLAHFQRQLAFLRTVQRPELERRLRRAQAFLAPALATGVATVARDDLAALDERIGALETRLATAQVIGTGPVPPTVQPGFPVTVRYDDGTEETLMIVGALEADPSRGYVAIESPAGKALLGKAPGDTVSVHADGTAMTLTIDEIGSPSADGATSS